MDDNGGDSMETETNNGGINGGATGKCLSSFVDDGTVESHRYYLSRRTLLEMLRDRGYDISDSEINLTLKQFRDLHGQSIDVDRLRISASHVSYSDNKILAVYCGTGVVKVNSIRWIATQIMNKESLSRLIIVVQNHITSQAMKAVDLFQTTSPAKYTLIRTIYCVMTRPYRFLSTAVVESPEEASVKSDFVFILAALLCALVSVVGLIAVVHCAWIRHRSVTNRTPGQPSAANKGIEKKYVETIPKFTYDSAREAKGGDCVICLVEYADGDEIRVLPQCGHGFHIECIDMWLRSHSSCPSCRQIVVIGKCKKCDEVSVITAGKTQLVPEHEGGQYKGGSSSVNKIEGS